MRNTTFPLLGLGSIHLTLVDPWSIRRALIGKYFLENWFLLNLKSSLRRIPTFGSYLSQLPTNLLKLLLLKLFSMNHETRHVHAKNQHS